MSLRKQALSGTIWTTGSAGILAIIQILRLSILTRFLEKSDFGLVAIVIMILGFTHIFTDLGVSVSLFSRNNITKKEYSSLYWVSLMLGFALYCIMLIASPFIARFYNLPELKSLMPIMMLDLIITTAGRQFRIFRQKALLFKNLALIDISSAILSLIVAIVIARQGGGVWSIVFSTLFATSLSSILLILTGLKRHPIAFYINLKEGRYFYKVGLYQTGSQILDYFASQLDILIIGKTMSTSNLGVYSLVKQLAFRVYTILNPIITNVAVPLLASLNGNMTRLKEKYLQMLEVVSFANVYFYGILILLATEVLTIVYGQQYSRDAFFLQALCVWGAAISYIGATSTIISVSGRTDLGFKWTLVRIVTNPIFIIIGSFFGLNGIVIGLALCSNIFVSFYYVMLLKRVMKNITFKDYVLIFLKPYFKCILIVSLLLSLKIMFLNNFNNIYINISVLSVLFTALYLLTNRRFFLNFLNFLIRKEVAVS